MSGRIQLDRRTFLKGIGVSIALPWLEAMRPALLPAADTVASAAPVRMAFVFFPNGAIPETWNSTGEGADYKLSPTLEPLTNFQSQINVLSGLAQDNGREKGDGAGDHARCAASYLTGAHPVKTSGKDIRNGVSVDQVAAEQIGKLTSLPSLELGIEGGRNAGSCDSGYSCAYSSNISWKTPTTPMAKEINPKLAFERLFGDGAKDRVERDYFRRSILDFVSEDTRRLQAKLGQQDRQKVDEYFESVRDLELRIQRAAERSGIPRPEIALPDGVPEDKTEHIRLMYDLLTLAFQTDSTRIATFMLGNAGSNRSYPMVDVKEGHHELSHHGNDAEKVAKISKIDRYLVEQFAYFLEKLNSIREGERTLLENSMIVYGSGLGDGNRHTHHDLPIVLAGNAGGRIQTGRHLHYPIDTPMNNLFLSMLDYAGADVKGIGDSNGRLKRLEA